MPGRAGLVHVHGDRPRLRALGGGWATVVRVDDRGGRWPRRKVSRNRHGTRERSMADDLVAEVRRKASALPAEGVPVVRRARRRPLSAAEPVAAALAVDPPLAEPARCRDIDLLDEVVRQLRPLAK